MNRKRPLQRKLDERVNEKNTQKESTDVALRTAE